MDPTLNFWEDGNGSRNEKADAFYHLEKHSKNALDFHRKAWQPFIKSYNHKDAEPKGHWTDIQGLGQAEQDRSHHHRHQKTHKNGKKWYWWELALNNKKTEDFYRAARKPEIPSDNHNDTEPAENFSKKSKMHYSKKHRKNKVMQEEEPQEDIDENEEMP